MIHEQHLGARTMNSKPFPQLCADIIDQEIAAIRAFMHDADQALDREAAPGSGIERIKQWAAGLPHETREQRAYRGAVRAAIDSSAGAILRLLANGYDHAQALSTALRAEHRVTGAALTLSRGTLEAILQICYLLDPAAQPHTTILRAIVFEAATFEGNEKTANTFGDRATPDQHKLARESVDRFHRWLIKAGITRAPAKKNGKRQSVSLSYGGETVNLRFNVTDAMRDYLFDEGFFYAVFSGAAHSSGWLLADAYLPDATGHVTTADQQALAATVPLLDASEALVRTIAFWTGTDPKAVMSATHLRRRALLVGRGQAFSPLSLEDYRARMASGGGRRALLDAARRGDDAGRADTGLSRRRGGGRQG